MSKFGYAISFICGAVIGSAVSYHISKDKFEKKLNDELKVLRKHSGDKLIEYVETNGINTIDDPENRMVASTIHNSYISDSEKVDYTAFSKIEHTSEIPEEITPIDCFFGDGAPFLVGPDDIDSEPDYDQITWTYYIDGVLTDEDDEIVTNIEDTVGIGYNQHFTIKDEDGVIDYKDSIIIRNPRLKIDYEILFCMVPYSQTHQV